jgi:hypothetical protein
MSICSTGLKELGLETATVVLANELELAPLVIEFYDNPGRCRMPKGVRRTRRLFLRVVGVESGAS